MVSFRVVQVSGLRVVYELKDPPTGGATQCGGWFSETFPDFVKLSFFFLL